MRFESFGLSDVGLRRSHNEDSFHRSDELGVFVVADGMGGHAAGEVASNSAIQSIVEFARRGAEEEYVTWPFGFDPRHDRAVNVLLNGMRIANQRIYLMQQERPELSGMGTTIAALLLQEGKAVTAHVGDSRVYRWRGNRMEQLTSDHSWVNEQLMKNIITAEEARNHRYKNVITRALGNRVDLEIDVRTEELLVGDVFLVCSDGLSGMIDDDTISHVLTETHDLRECANRLVTAANEAGGHDNITVIMIRCVE